MFLLELAEIFPNYSWKKKSRVVSLNLQSNLQGYIVSLQSNLQGYLVSLQSNLQGWVVSLQSNLQGYIGTVSFDLNLQCSLVSLIVNLQPILVSLIVNLQGTLVSLIVNLQSNLQPSSFFMPKKMFFSKKCCKSNPKTVKKWPGDHWSNPKCTSNPKEQTHPSNPNMQTNPSKPIPWTDFFHILSPALKLPSSGPWIAVIDKILEPKQKSQQTFKM